MAKRFRLEALPKDQQEKLRVFSNQYFPGQLKEKFLDSIEKTGTISKELFDQGNFNERDRAMVGQQVGQITQGILSNRDAYQRFITGQGDEANLTDQELKDRAEAYQGLSGPLPVDHGTLEREIGQTLKVNGVSNNISQEGVGPLPSSIADLAISLGRWPSASEIVNHVKNLKGVPPYSPDGTFFTNFTNSPEFRKFTNDNQISTYFTNFVKNQIAPDHSADTRRVQDLLTGRQKKAQSNADIMSFFESQPGELTKSREALFDPQRARAKDYVQEVYAPGVRERLAARGLENSGEVASAVTAKYADLFGAISDSEAEQLVSDTEFFQQQSYDKVFTDLVNAQSDVSGAIGSARNTLRTKQITDFAKSQSDIESKFSFDLFQQQAKAAYDTYQRQVADKNNALRSQNQADMIGDIAKVGTTVAIASML